MERAQGQEHYSKWRRPDRLRKDISAGREKDGDSGRMSSRLGGRGREERRGKALARAAANRGQNKRT